MVEIIKKLLKFINQTVIICFEKFQRMVISKNGWVMVYLTVSRYPAAIYYESLLLCLFSHQIKNSNKVFKTEWKIKMDFSKLVKN